MANVSIKSANKYYGAYHAIRDVSVDIEDGEFVVLVGPSGCGKSTLLRMLAGLEVIEGGDIVIGDKNVNDLPPKSRNIAMVFQNYALYPHMSVAQNMSFSLWLQRMPKAEIKAKVDRAASILGLETLLDRKPKQLSGGQRQRVAMGRAIVRDPQVFLFDEPLSNLDAKLRVQMRGEIRELHHRLCTTTIYVTHDQVEAMTMADKIVVMQNGIVEQAGAPLELYDRPINAFVAGFIGSPAMNFLDGSVENGTFVTSSGLRIPLTDNAPPNAVRLGIRPEHITLQSDGMALKLSVVEPTGGDTQITGKIGGHTIVGVFRERILSKPGEIINLTFDAGKIHLFDKHGATIQTARNSNMGI